MSIADFALYPVVRARYDFVERLGNLPHLTRWAQELGARPGVARGMVTDPGRRRRATRARMSRRCRDGR